MVVELETKTGNDIRVEQNCDAFLLSTKEKQKKIKDKRWVSLDSLKARDAELREFVLD